MAESPALDAARATHDRPARDRSATQRRIVDAGERLLLRDGFPGVNVQTVAAEAGCDRKLVYRYFDSIDGVVTKLAERAMADLVRALDARPPFDAQTPAAFARDSLRSWLAALRSSPLSLRLMAWALAEARPVLTRIEAERSALLQAWMRERRPRLKSAPEGDPAALNAILLGAVQQLALAEQAGRPVGGLTLDDAGWPRVEAALDRLLVAFE